jgi:hypothetical protein
MEYDDRPDEPTLVHLPPDTGPFAKGGILGGMLQFRDDSPDDEGKRPAFGKEGLSLSSTHGCQDKDPTAQYSNKTYKVAVGKVVKLASPFGGRAFGTQDVTQLALKQVGGKGREASEATKIPTCHHLYCAAGGPFGAPVVVVDHEGPGEVTYEMTLDRDFFPTVTVSATYDDISIIFPQCLMCPTQAEKRKNGRKYTRLPKGWHLFVTATFGGVPETTMLPVSVVKRVRRKTWPTKSDDSSEEAKCNDSPEEAKCTEKADLKQVLAKHRRSLGRKLARYGKRCSESMPLPLLERKVEEIRALSSKRWTPV